MVLHKNQIRILSMKRNFKTILICVFCILGIFDYSINKGNTEKYIYEYNQEALKMIKYTTIDYNKQKSLSHVKVAIIDEGIKKQSTINFVELRNSTANEEASHGTVIANLLGAQYDPKTGYHGLLPNIPLYAFSLSSNEMDTSNLTDVINTVINWNVDIISISMGTNTENDNLKIAIQDAVKNGIIVVCSSGNNPNQPNYPASYDIPGVISVGAIGDDYNILPYTNVNSQVDIYAPGENIISYDGSEINEYSGTSVSVPFVIMACIYIKAYSPLLSPSEVENLLIQKSDTYLAKWQYEQRQIRVINMSALMDYLNI